MLRGVCGSAAGWGVGDGKRVDNGKTGRGLGMGRRFGNGYKVRRDGGG